ncbi:MAG TPA: metallopeptidase family protein [Candidatus Paceibacterota bacterium]|nr:metallopeptidase family protein [Candidatus Paceibacterota bacterium]
MRRDEFERLVEEGYLAIPEQYRAKVKNVAFLIEDEPDEETRQEEGLAPDETLFGLYRGVPISARGDEYGMGMYMPDTITIYQQPIEAEAAGDPELIRRIVADTVWHEVGHYLGFDEDAIRAKEHERGMDDYHPHED